MCLAGIGGTELVRTLYSRIQSALAKGPKPRKEILSRCSWFFGDGACVCVLRASFVLHLAAATHTHTHAHTRTHTHHQHRQGKTVDHVRQFRLEPKQLSSFLHQTSRLDHAFHTPVSSKCAMGMFVQRRGAFRISTPSCIACTSRPITPHYLHTIKRTRCPLPLCLPFQDPPFHISSSISSLATSMFPVQLP